MDPVTLNKCWKVRGCFASETPTPSPRLPGTIPVPRGYSSLQTSSPVAEEREYLFLIRCPRPLGREGWRLEKPPGRPGEGDGRGGPKFANIYLVMTFIGILVLLLGRGMMSQAADEIDLKALPAAT